MIRSMLEGALERHGLAEIPTADMAFDPNMHEAIGLDPDSDAPAGQVTQVIQRGYQMDGRVLRASRVVVSGRSEKETEDSAASGSGTSLSYSLERSSSKFPFSYFLNSLCIALQKRYTI